MRYGYAGRYEKHVFLSSLKGIGAGYFINLDILPLATRSSLLPVILNSGIVVPHTPLAMDKPYHGNRIKTSQTFCASEPLSSVICQYGKSN